MGWQAGELEDVRAKLQQLLLLFRTLVWRARWLDGHLAWQPACCAACVPERPQDVVYWTVDAPPSAAQHIECCQYLLGV